MNRLLCTGVVTLTSLARIVPYSLSGFMERLALRLLALAAIVKPTPIEDSFVGMPWLGQAVCEDIDCRHEWMVFAPEGVGAEANLECPECGNDAGILV